MGNLIALSDEQRRAANIRYDDPAAWKSVEHAANRQLREDVRRLTTAIETAYAHPDDPDCAKLLAVLTSLGSR